MRALLVAIAMINPVLSEEMSPQAVLTSSTVFALGGVGYSGQISTGEIALRKIITLPN